MNINTEQIVSISEANQNFSRVARMVDRTGEVYIFKNNKPKYRLVDIESDTTITRLRSHGKFRRNTKRNAPAWVRSFLFRGIENYSSTVSVVSSTASGIASASALASSSRARMDRLTFWLSLSMSMILASTT